MKLFFSSSIVLSLLFSPFAFAVTTVVDSHHCGQVKGIDKPFMLVLRQGEIVPDAILQCAKDAQLAGASLSALGALIDPTLNYFNHSTKKYQEKVFPGMLELDVLSGNITHIDNKTIAHLHVALSDDTYHMMGGHLSKATVGPTMEITVIPFQQKLVKKHDDNVGTDLIQTDNK